MNCIICKNGNYTRSRNFKSNIHFKVCYIVWIDWFREIINVAPCPWFLLFTDTQERKQAVCGPEAITGGQKTAR